MQATLPITESRPDKAFPGRLAAWCEANHAWVLAALVVIAAGIRLAILREFWIENPFATLPTLDSELYWQRAGEIAGGNWWTGEPFHIAPLYPHLLGVLRWLGGGLLAVYGAQLALHLTTACAIAAATRLRFGGAAGCLAAALFLGLSEPALFATRILGTTLQLALVAGLWWDWTRLALAPEPKSGHSIRIGIWIGLLALAFPAAVLLIPCFGFWLLRAPRQAGEAARSRFRRAALGTAAAVLVVAPATLHNALATRDFVPITSHAGITLAAGNGPGSIGIFTPIAETSGAVANQAHESARAFELETGRSGSWREVDAYFRNRAFRWWWENPAEAVALFARKAWWFLTSRHYDNVTAFALEREYGLQDASAPLLLEVPWLLGLALVGFAAMARRREPCLAELALVGLSFAVCLLFMYSARYRILAAPVLCGMAAAAVVRWDWAGWQRSAAALVVLLPAPLLAANAVAGFGSLDFMREDFTRLLADRYVASAVELRQRGDAAGAERQLGRAASVDTDGSAAYRTLALFHLESDRFEQARAAALDAVRRDSTDEMAHRLLYDAQIHGEDYRKAAITLDLIEQLAPGDGGVQIAMAWFYAACPDLTRRNSSRALHHARAAERLLGAADPDAAMAMALAAAAAGDFPQAIAAARRGAEIADERADANLNGEFGRLLSHMDGRHAIASRPRLLAGR